MKKLLFIFTLAAIFTVATSSFKSLQSGNGIVLQTVTVASANSGFLPEDVKKEDKKEKQATTSSCCQAKTQKAECPQAQKKSCPASKAECPQEKKCDKK